MSATPLSFPAALGRRLCRVARGCLGTLLGLTASAGEPGEWLDRVGEKLQFSTAEGAVRARLSGTLDLEGYQFSRPPPGLIDASGEALFNPRLTLFVDAQAGPAVYVFAQGRIDRGFDPAANVLRARLDEYAVRFAPGDAKFQVQIGKFATVVGNWIARHGSWDNPFVTAPLPYENLTGIWDAVAPRSPATLLEWAHVRPRPITTAAVQADRHERLPILWGPSYAGGAAVFAEWGKFQAAAEVKGAGLSSRPESWEPGDWEWRHPTVTGRVGYRPNAMWGWGTSASVGAYLLAAARPSLPAGRGLGDYRQIVVAQDVSFAWRRWQVWAEAFATRFQVPRSGEADTLAYYVEAKYKFTPQFFGAVRWNQQLFATIADGAGGRARWGDDLWRLEVAPGYRWSAHTQVKVQYSLERHTIAPQRFGHLLAGQVTVRF